MAKRYLSTVHTAQALGVSVTTVKRWVDDGVLPAHKTAGGHRKILVGDVLRLVHSGQLPCADLGPLLGFGSDEPPNTTELADRLCKALLAGKIDEGRAAIHAAIKAGMGWDVIGDEIIQPALAQIGHEWKEGSLEVYQEHQSTQTLLTVLHEFKAQMPASAGRPLALGGGVEGDHYQLANLLIQMVLLDKGWQAVNIGPNTPAASFAAALHDMRPRLFWLSVTHLDSDDHFLADLETIKQAAQCVGATMVVGGQALSEQLQARIQGVHFGRNLAFLGDMADRVQRGISNVEMQ